MKKLQGNLARWQIHLESTRFEEVKSSRINNAVREFIEREQELVQ